ncbi:hypothetical protein CHUAL_006213 [Chamberlinius hualienensis]
MMPFLKRGKKTSTSSSGSSASRVSADLTPTTPTTPAPNNIEDADNNNGGFKYPAEEVENVDAPFNTVPASGSSGSIKESKKGSKKPPKKPSTTLPPSPLVNPPPPPPLMMQKPKLVFHCQQAHGSPTGIISGFTSIKELYEKIASCYDFPASEILFCTLNTHKVDMNSLLGGQIGLEDFIFAHRKGQTKEIEITKTEDALGLTITDNGAGYCFIKKIREGSVIDKAGYIHVGDHIEKIDGNNLVDKKHFEVAKILKDIPKGTVFIIRLVEPLTSGFSIMEIRNKPMYNKKGGVGTGKKTIRLKASGQAVEQEALDDIEQKAITKIDNLLETFMGINDNDLATQIWEVGQTISNPIEFGEEIQETDLNDFGFTQDFIFDLWGIISDAKAGRLDKKQ